MQETPAKDPTWTGDHAKRLISSRQPKCRCRWVYNDYSDIKEIASLQKNNSPLRPSMWKKEATSYYFCFVKFPWSKDHGQKLFIFTRHYHKCGFRVHTNFRMTLCSIITPFTIFKMVSWSTSAELDVADPPENTWWSKEVYCHLRCPPKVARRMNSTYFQTLIKFDFLWIARR